MVKLVVSKGGFDSILVEARKKVDGVKSLRTDYNREQIAKAVFVIAGKEFVRQTGIYASGHKKSMHHVYEWGQVGNSRYRLFTLNRTYVKGGSLTITTDFKDSRKASPVHPTLMIPGKNARVVRSGQVFKKKASVMEAGKPIFITATRAKAITIPTKNGIVFIPRGRGVVVRNPGGKNVSGSFTKFTREWFKNPNNINSALENSGFFNRLEKELAKELSIRDAGTERVSSVIKRVSDSYSKGIKVI